MTFTLRCPRCDAPVRMIDDNGVSDPAKMRWEKFECERKFCDKTFSRTLEPRQ